MRKNKIYIVGDVHGYWGKITGHMGLFNVDDSFYIQVGDFGLGFNWEKERQTLIEVNEILKTYNNILYVIRGNHDNPYYWSNEFLNSDVYADKSMFSNIILVKDNSVIEILGEKFLMTGGAISIDRVDRNENLNWWKNEVFYFDEKLIKTIKDVNHVITHTAPHFCRPVQFNKLVYDYAKNDPSLLLNLSYEREELTNFYNILARNNKIKMWFYGHFHNTFREKMNEAEFYLLDINEIVDFDTVR